MNLERPNDRWQGLTWRGPRGTTCADWAREVLAISDAIEAREELRAQRKGYVSDPGVLWRLDCLADLLTVLEHNAAEGLQYQGAQDCSTMDQEQREVTHETTSI